MTLNEDTAANLRKAADLLAAHPDLEQPYVTSRSTGAISLSWYLHHERGSAEKAAAVVRAIDGTWERGEADYSGPLATWSQVRDGLELDVSVSREQVCERVVVGVEEVTIPAVPAQPERVEEREKVEWKCGPLLSALP